MRLLGLVSAVVLILALAAAALAQVPAPLAVTNRAVGGGDWQYDAQTGAGQRGVENGVGLNNIGLLIRTWGKVTAVNTTDKYFYIDDGMGRLDGTGNVGIRVSYDNLAPGNTITPPPDPLVTPTYVLVTAISSTFLVGDQVQPNLRPRSDSDIQILSL